MGSIAILKSVYDYKINPKSIIIETPFNNLLITIRNRFKIMNAPSFPFAELLTFWGGVINGFNAFNHDSTKYAELIKCPILIMYGENDDRAKKENGRNL